MDAYDRLREAAANHEDNDPTFNMPVSRVYKDDLVLVLDAVEQLAKELDEERSTIVNVQYTEPKIRKLLNEAVVALLYWLPDETMVKPEEDAAWDEGVKLVQRIQDALKDEE
jgi:hypothetical protein